MRKLAYIFFIALFLFGCATRGPINRGPFNHILNVSYDPVDYPRQFFSLKDNPPTLYLDSVIDNREFAAEQKLAPHGGFQFPGTTVRSGRIEEDPTLIGRLDGLTTVLWRTSKYKAFWRTSKTPPVIIGEALETEVHRFGVKTTKDRGSADGVLKASIEKFNPNLNSSDKTKLLVKISLNLYQTGFDNPVWSGTLKGIAETDILDKKGLKGALNTAIKSWYSYPDFKEALVRLAGNITSPSPQPVVQRPSVQQQVVSGGTGFLFSSKDYIITNYHVVKGKHVIKAKFTNGDLIDADIVSKDAKNDIAILKLKTSSSITSRELKFGDSSKARMGEKVFTIGFPVSSVLGERPKYTEGVISAVTGIKDDPTVFQITVPIQPGNSGGPLFNQRGEVIGITTASLSLRATEVLGAIPQNINYALKSSFVKNLLASIPESLLSNRGIVVVPKDPENSLADFIEAVTGNVVLIEAKE